VVGAAVREAVGTGRCRTARRSRAVIEVCFCGHSGELADRIPVDDDEGYGLRCPACGHVDRMRAFPEWFRVELWSAAVARHVPDTPVPADAPATPAVAGGTGVRT
jgi:hypothetical protein